MFSRLTDLPVRKLAMLTETEDENGRVSTTVVFETSLGVLEIAALATMQSKGASLFITIETDQGKLPFEPSQTNQPIPDSLSKKAFDLLADWRDIVNSKALIKCHKGEETFVSSVVARQANLLTEVQPYLEV